MSTLVIAGIPAAVICLLTGIVIFERRTEKIEARKRVEKLKRWLHSQTAH